MEKEVMLITKENIKDKIYYIRNKKVMLDFELAKIYGYTTKRFNEQVKNNIEKFDEDFMFRLNKEEFESLRSDFTTSNRGGTRYMPYAFTEQGVYMLMTVLKGELATKQSKSLIRLFKEMKDYIIESENLLNERDYLKLSLQSVENEKEIVDLKKSIYKIENNVLSVMNDLKNVVKKSELSNVILDFEKKKIKSDYLILNGQALKADLAYKEIYSLAKKSIYIVDNYIGLKTLVLFKDIDENIELIIFSDNINKNLHKIEYKDFITEYPNIRIELKTTNGIFHDRYIIIDYNTENEIIYHCGASSKDAGNRITTITRVLEKNLYKDIIDKLLKNKKLKL